MRTTSTNNAGSSVNFGGELDPVDIESLSERLEGRKVAKFAKRLKVKAVAITNEEASFEHVEKTEAEYLHHARQNFESKIRMEAKMQEM